MRRELAFNFVRSVKKVDTLENLPGIAVVTATWEPPAATISAMAAAVAHRVTETTVSARSHRQRSATADANGARIADGTIRSNDTRPTALAPPSLNAYTESTTVKVHSAVQAPGEPELDPAYGGVARAGDE